MIMTLLPWVLLLWTERHQDTTLLLVKVDKDGMCVSQTVQCRVYHNIPPGISSIMRHRFGATPAELAVQNTIRLQLPYIA
jgi:hypothetical protein